MRKLFVLFFICFSFISSKIFSCPREVFHDEVIKTIESSNGIYTLTDEAIIIDIEKMEARYKNMPESVFMSSIYKPTMLNFKLFAMNHYLKIESLKDGKKELIF